jgi:hypothetical protein
VIFDVLTLSLFLTVDVFPVDIFKIDVLEIAQLGKLETK